MPLRLRKTSSTIRNGPDPALPLPGQVRQTVRHRLQKSLCAGLACLFPLLAPTPGTAADAPRPVVGEAYIFNPVVEAKTDSTPDQTLEQALRIRAMSAGEMLDPASRAWAGAQGLSLRLERAAALLATDVIASTGDGQAAAASHADGRIRTFGAGNCTLLTMPEGHPAYALALAKGGNVLAAWAQGVSQLVFFDLHAPGCPATTANTALRGHISLSLSASGAFLAAQDADGNVWIGPRGGGMRRVTTLSGAPAAIGFSDGEGVLLVLDAQGRGGSWSPRTGKRLGILEIPGGPFARGEFHGTEARLWSTNGRLVRWNVLHNRAMNDESAADAADRPSAGGWLELRGTDLYSARAGLSWRPEPVYEPRLPQLSLSRHAACLRLSDVDGQVRYFDARTGSVRGQCFADDWTQVAVQTDGTAQIPGLRLRIFDTSPRPGGGSKVNIRAISETQVQLWLDSPPDLSLRVQAPPASSAITSQKAADRPPEARTVLLRQGIAADAPVRPLRLD